MEKMEIKRTEIRTIDTVVEFIFGPDQHIVFGEEDRRGLEVGRDSKTKKIVAYMSLSFPQLHRQILEDLERNPIPGTFSVDTVMETGTEFPVCDPRVKNATFAEIVQWVWEKYYSHHEEQAAVEIAALNNNVS